MAFVIVQHLDPTHASALVDLLVRSVTMPVSEATDGVHVQANHVYVIPPNTNLTIVQGTLHLAPRERHQLHLPINQFFRSLADDQGSNAIGVILSGSGSDGTLGLEAIKFEGGLTFAQDAGSAKYDGMPRSAAGSGCLDLILPPAGIAEQLAKIADHPYLRPDTPARATPDEDAGTLAKIFALLLKGTGIDFRLYRQSTVKRRIMRRMLLRRKRRLDQYVNDLRTHGDELQALQQDLLIGVTSFFREPDTFEVLRRTVLPRLLKDRPRNQPLRAWVAGCSTGEEVYSLAIALVESFEERGDRRPIQIFGTDANDAAIVKARVGLYSDASTSEMAPARLQRFFAPVDGHQQVTKRIRDLCVFAKHDLTRDPPFSNMDLITCCNVLIYFEAPVQKQILQNLHYALTPTGLLILGRSERVGAASDLFAPLNGSHRIHVPKPRRTTAGLRLPARDTRIEGRPVGGLPATAAHAGFDGGGELERQVRRLLVEQYAPPGIVVNDQWDIVHFSGRPNPYIQPAAGAASFNVLRMAPEGLALELRRLIATARRKSRAVRKDGLRVLVHGQPHDLSLEATPVPDGATGSSPVMVVFDRATSPARAVRAGTKAARRNERAGASDTETTRLKRELADVREYLHDVVQDQEAANEELKSANEEILSSNEELQSTNEELETAKEELQSSNEELHTLNEELQHRNVELRRTSDDLSNLLTSTILPVVMLGRDLRIRRFTPVAERILHLHNADIGRSIDDIKLPFTVPELGPWLLDVLKTAVAQEHEVQDREGCWYRVAVRAYKTMDHAIDGVLIVLTDIDAVKRSEQAMAEARDYAEAIITTVREPLVVLDDALKVMTANAAFYDFFHMTPRETEHHFIFSLGGRQWDIPALRTLLTDLFAENKTFEDFEVSADFPVRGTRTLLLNARPLRGGQARLGLLAFEDVTERTRVQQERERLLIAAEDARHEAEAANQAKDDFLTAVSHELRTPLNVLLGWIWRLRTGTLDEASRSRALESIDRNAKLQTKLVEDLLDVSRIRRGGFHVDLVPIALQPVVAAAIQSVQPLADGKDLRLELVVGKGTFNVLGDAARLQQVVWNLLSNALKFTPPDGHIQVRLSAINGALRLQVSDTGQGISPQVLPHIFEAFRQGDDSATYQREGLGLGLAIVKAIVERHGGTVYAASPGPGKGATLTLELPALAGAQQVMQAPEGATRKPFSVPELAGVHALVVDDGIEARELLGLMLQEYGASVTAVASAKEAIEVFKRQRPDVILSDIQMPDEDGYSLIATIRALEIDRGHPIPAIAVTAYSSSEDRQRALAAGFQRHIVKPVEAERLAAVIADLVLPDRS
jgi:two-component system, chemotaxis family, CheB/CheR fusion protein